MENMVVIEEMLTDVSHEAAPQLKPEIGRIAGRETYSLAEADASMPKASVRADSAESVGQFKNILENAPIGVAITDSDGRFMHVNRAMCELVGYSEQALLKSTFQGITYPEDVYADLARSRQMLAGTISTYQREKRCVRADGDIVWVLVSASITAGPQGKPPYIISHVQDLSEHKRLEMQLHDLALSDRLTGLANRTLFENRLALALIWARRRARKIAVLFLDLERFKLINDSFGHDAGDNLLIAVADRLKAALRSGDTAARLGGDEFTVLCEDIGELRDVVDIVVRIENSLSKGFLVCGEEVRVRASIGIAVSDTNRQDSPESLLRDADAAMYKAKEHGKGTYEIFDEGMRVEAAERLRLDNALYRAIERDELRVFYQPQVCVSKGKIMAAEALARWDHAERGLLAPEEFIPFAEDNGSIVRIGEWVLHEACRQAERWRTTWSKEIALPIAVNFSARQLAQPDFLEILSGALQETGADPSFLCLEITETVMMQDAESTIEVLEAVKALGVEVAIDDFGTGYSSLSYLKRFPVDILKIDQSFVRELGKDEAASFLVEGVINLARPLSLVTVAEGVETPEQLLELQALGCDLAQGFHFARPQPAARMEGLLSRINHW
jgi:diguanylate cyclase (GGDEF)-like protein/PAS domain S-box-containing protein